MLTMRIIVSYFTGIRFEKMEPSQGPDLRRSWSKCPWLQCLLGVQDTIERESIAYNSLFFQESYFNKLRKVLDRIPWTEILRSKRAMHVGNFTIRWNSWSIIMQYFKEEKWEQFSKYCWCILKILTTTKHSEKYTGNEEDRKMSIYH